MTTLDLKPMTTSELLDRTFFLYRKYFPLFVGIAVTPALVIFLAEVLYSSYSAYIMAAAMSGAGIISIVPMLALAMLIYAAVILFANAIAQGATIAAVSDVYLGRQSSIGKAFDGLRGKVLSIIFATILMFILVFIGAIFLIVPGIIFLTAFVLTVPAIVIENHNPVAALGRSWDLTKGSRLRVLAVYAILIVLTYIVSIVFAIPGLIMTGISGLKDPTNISMLARILSAAGTFFAACLTTPLGAIAFSLLYYDQRARKEGFDLQFMLASLESKESPMTQSEKEP